VKKPVVIAGVAAVVVLALGYFFVMPMMKGKAAPAPTATAAAGADDSADPAATPKPKRKKHPTEPGLMYPLSERVLNLAASPSGGTHFARIQLTLEFERPAVGPGSKPPVAKAGAADAKSTAVVLEPGLESVTARKAQIDDAIVRVVGSKTFEMMTTDDGREALKQEIMDAISDIVPSPDISAVYINNLIVQ
jgi:flagellar basal body-associated protein FliL